MSFQREKIEDIEVVILSGRFDTEKARNVEKDFDELCNTGTVNAIVVMNDVNYISSSMIRVLLKSLKKVKGANGDLKLAGLQPKIMEIMKIAGMDSLFDIHEDKDIAMKSFL